MKKIKFKKKALKMTSSSFFSFSELFFFLFNNISRTNSKTSEVNQQSILNL